MSFRYREQAATLRAFIKFQAVVIGLQILALFGAGFGWYSAVQQQSFHVPPDLRSGAVVRKGEVPDANVYAFTHYIFQQLNRWPVEGSTDYGNNLYRLAAYITPPFRAALEADLELRAKRGELTGRTRAVQEIPGTGYEERRVDVLGNGSWTVWLDLQISEWVKGMKVKDAVVRFPLRVVRYDVDRELNPWGLALNGFADPGPRRLSEAEQARSAGREADRS